MKSYKQFVSSVTGSIHDRDQLFKALPEGEYASNTKLEDLNGKQLKVIAQGLRMIMQVTKGDMGYNISIGSPGGYSKVVATGMHRAMLMRELLSHLRKEGIATVKLEQGGPERLG